MNDNRPDPNQLLAQVQSDENELNDISLAHKTTPVKGRLKVFLGYCAGVGKTYRMLQQAIQKKRQGVDVVVGLVESHQRSETAALLEGLEIIPLKESDYNGLPIKEMDLDALLTRKPELALVDELPHSNIHTRHEKRYQSVEELLNAGIDVYTACNVQHINSLNDLVLSITGIRITEIIPDSIIETAYEIEVVDLAPDELIVRLHEGKIYIKEMSALAVSNFFRRSNLIALRELTLDYAARYVDRSMISYREVNAVIGPWPLGTRILAAFSANPESEQLLRYTSRLSKELNTSWYAVTVDTLLQSSRSEANLNQNIMLAHELGATVEVLKGEDRIGEILNFATKKNVMLITAGYSKKSSFRNIFRKSFLHSLINRSGRIHVLAVGLDIRSRRHRSYIQTDRKATSKHYFASIGGLTITTLCGWLIDPWIEPINIAMLFLIPTFISNILCGFRVGLTTALLGVLAFDFIFIPPVLTLTVDDLRYIPVFVVFILISLMIGFLTRLVMAQSERSRNREHFISSLLNFSRDILNATDRKSIMDQAALHITSALGNRLVFFLSESNGDLTDPIYTGDSEDLSDNEKAIAAWVYKNGSPAGRGTGTLSSTKWYFTPIRSADKILGVTGIRVLDSEQTLNHSKITMLESFINTLAIAVSRK